MNRMNRLSIIASSLSMLLTACASRPLLEEQPLEQSLSPIDQPEWVVGYRQFLVDAKTGEESSWEIQSIDEEGRVTVKSSNGCEWTVAREWFVGAERWENCGGQPGIRKVISAEGSLWPLAVGKTSKYKYEMLSEGSAPKIERLNCEVVNEARVTVALGDLDVFRVECVRVNKSSVQTRTWYWSPDVGEVKYIRHDSQKGVRRNVDIVRTENG